MILIDAIVVKIRDGQVANRPIYVAMGVNMDGERDVLGCWVGPTGGEGAKFWMSVLTELRNRGIQDTFIVCCDGLKGLPDSIRATWPLADVQLCVVHLVRSSLRYTSKKHWGQVCRELREIYTAPTLDAAQARFDEFAEQWRERYPAMIDAWERAWGEFTPFLAFPVELRTIVYTTNAIESLNARFRKAVRHRGHFPNEQSALKVLYLVATQRRPNRANPTGRINAWKGHPERPDHPLRRPHPGRQLTTSTVTAGYTQDRTVPLPAPCAWVYGCMVHWLRPLPRGVVVGRWSGRLTTGGSRPPGRRLNGWRTRYGGGHRSDESRSGSARGRNRHGRGPVRESCLAGPRSHHRRTWPCRWRYGRRRR